MHQDQASKLKISLENNVDAINNSVGVVEYKMHGEFISANEKYLRIAGITIGQFTGKLQSMFMMKERVNSNEFQSLWSDLGKGKTRSIINQYFFDENERWLYEIYTPVKNEKGEYYKVITFAHDITDLSSILNKYSLMQSN
ncbi:MAG: PAS domain-containing protein [Candidatus Omnitrophota bacterium]